MVGRERLERSTIGLKVIIQPFPDLPHPILKALCYTTYRRLC